MLSGNLPRRLRNGTFEYCPVDEALGMCHLRPVQVYIAQRQARILAHVERRPIYNLCKAAKRASGTPAGAKFWWEQDLSHWVDIRKDEDAADIVCLRELGV
jgi:hypothetical protein